VPVAPGLATPSATHQTGFGRWLLVLAAGLAVVCVVGYRVLSSKSARPILVAAAPALPEPAATPTTTPEPAPTAANAESAPVASVAEAAASAEPAPTAANAEPAPAASAAELAPRTAAAEAASGTNIRRVTVKSNPPKVRLFHFGKPIGVTPFVLELKPGERHAYEAGLPGYGTRKVVIDGSKPEITVGLRREKP